MENSEYSGRVSSFLRALVLIVTFQPRQDRASLTQPNFQSLPSYKSSSYKNQHNLPPAKISIQQPGKSWEMKNSVLCQSVINLVSQLLLSPQLVRQSVLSSPQSVSWSVFNPQIVSQSPNPQSVTDESQRRFSVYFWHNLWFGSVFDPPHYPPGARC